MARPAMPKRTAPIKRKAKMGPRKMSQPRGSRESRKRDMRKSFLGRDGQAGRLPHEEGAGARATVSRFFGAALLHLVALRLSGRRDEHGAASLGGDFFGGRLRKMVRRH